MQERLADKEARVQAAQERNRLKTQDAAKKRQLDKLRQEQNTSVDDGEVRRLPLLLHLFMIKPPMVPYGLRPCWWLPVIAASSIVYSCERRKASLCIGTQCRQLGDCCGSAEAAWRKAAAIHAQTSRGVSTLCPRHCCQDKNVSSVTFAIPLAVLPTDPTG